jgi:hypothetical protein
MRRITHPQLILLVVYLAIYGAHTLLVSFGALGAAIGRLDVWGTLNLIQPFFIGACSLFAAWMLTRFRRVGLHAAAFALAVDGLNSLSNFYKVFFVVYCLYWIYRYLTREKKLFH